MENFRLINNNMTYEEMLNAVNNNYENMSSMQKEISRLEVVQKEPEMSQEKSVETSTETLEEIIDHVQEKYSILDDIDFYYKNIYLLEINDSIKENISKALPKKDNSNYLNIILGILLNFQCELNEYQSEIERLKSECTDEELAEYYEEIEKINYKIFLVENLSNSLEVEKCQSVKNKIVLVNKPNGTPYIIDDLKSVAYDYYDGFLELIESIENGIFKNVKAFNSNNERLSGISEIRGFKVRILFERIGDDAYAIIAAFIKKCDNDKYYRSFITNRIAAYRGMRDRFLAQVNDEEFIQANDVKLNELYSIISNDNYERSKKYEL